MNVDLNAARVVAEVSRAGRLWFRLRLLTSLDTLDGPDKTLGPPAVSRHGDRVEVRCVSSRWRERVTILDTHPDRYEGQHALALRTGQSTQEARCPGAHRRTACCT